MSAVVVVVVSDVICPWCLIGTRRLDRALAAAEGLTVELRFHPFLLSPDTPPEGADLRGFLRARYGDPEPMFRRVETVARGDGIPLDFARVTRASSTVKAHTLVRHAAAGPAQHALVRALFGAYFLEGCDVGDEEVLVRLAGAGEIDADRARALLRDEAELAATRAEALAWSGRGVRGVPFFLFAARDAAEGARPLAVSGAQPVELLEEALRRAAA